MTGRRPDPPKTRLGLLMRSRRGETSGNDAAEQLDMSRTVYFAVERGSSVPSKRAAEVLGTWLGLTVGQVIDASRDLVEHQTPTPRRGRKPIVPRTKLGVLLRDKRGDKTGDEVAEEIGMDRGTYYRVERGVQAPSIPTCLALSAWLGLTVGQVIDASREPVESQQVG